MANGLPTKGQIIDGFRYLGGDPNDANSWEADSGLKPGAIADGYRFLGGDPNTEQSWQPVALEEGTRGAFDVVNDTVIEAANAVLGGVGAIADFVSPGNRLSQGTESLIREGEQSQSDIVRARKQAFRSELEGAEGFADEAGVAARYALENPGLIAAQAAGSYAVPGAAIKGVGTGARTLGLGQKATTRAQLGTGVVVGGAMAGGDAGGQAYDLVMQIPDDVLSQSPEYQSLLEGGMEPQAAREKLATDAARMASAVPAAIGAAGGAIGVERLLSGGKGFAGGVLSRGAKTGGVEALTEGFEEGVTGYSGRAAAAKLDPSIDPMKGVGGEAVIGAVTGFVPGAVIGGADAAMEPSRQRQLQAEQALRNAPDAATAAAAANELAGSVTELEAAVDQYLTPGGAIPSPAQAVAEQPTGPREDPTRSMIDRQATLISEAQAAGTQFDRQMALNQAQAALPQSREGRAAGFVDLTPMNEMQAQQRLAVLRDQTAQAGGNALGLAIVPHPAQADRFAIAEQALPDLSLPQTTPTITPDQAQFQIESAALGGQVSQARAEDSASRGPVIDQALKNVEERGGVASPAEARIFQEAGLGQPYDSVDSTLGTAEQPLIETAGAARESFTPNQQIADQEIQADQAARRESDIAQRDRTTEQQIAAAGQARQAPDAGTVISALVTPGAQRSAEQVRTINEARNRFSPADFSILERAATAPFQLNTEERMRLRELRNPPVTETSTNVPETGTGLMGTRVAERLGQPSGGRIVTTNAKLSTQRVAPGGTVSINDGNTQHEARIVDPSRVGIPGRLLKQIARIFNKRLVVFESDTLQADGFVMDGDNDSIYINVNSSISPLAVFGHELTHLLKRENPEAYAALEAVVQQEMRDGSMAEYEQEVGDGANLEEMTSDLVGNRFQEADFWQSVFDEIAAQNPEGARGIIARVTAAINRAINAFLKVVRQPGFQADQYVNDISAVKRAVNQAMAAYMQRPATEQATPEVISGAQNVTPEVTEQSRPSMAERLREAARAARTEMGETITASKARRGGVVEQAGDFTIRTQKDGTLGVTGEPEAIRELLPEGVAGRVVPGGMVFTATVAPRVRAALEGRKLGYSRAGQVTEKLPMKDGKYVGAPEKFNTPGKIPQLRKWLKTLAVEGEAGRYWYENSSREVLAMVGGNVTEARKFVALLSIYSPQAKVDANSTFALRAWAQYKAGQPISVKTGVQDRKAQEALDDVDAFWSGEKTGNFFFNLLREIDPSTAGRQGATIDMWMMRAGQYSNDAPTATQYAFMENETNRLAQELGWEPQQVQAAIWVAMKARMENAGVKKRTEASSEKNGWIRYEYPLKNGKPRKTRVIVDAQKHRDNWLKHSFEHDPTKDDTQQAKFDFSDGLRRHVGQLSWEARPGRSTNVLPGVNDAPYEQQVEFQQAVQKALLDDNGIDLLAYKLGMLVDGPDILAPGVWQGEIAAGMQKLVALAPAKGDEGKTSIDPAQKKAIETYAATLGLLLRQEGVGYHRPFYSGSLRNSNGVDLNIGRTLSPSEAQSLWAAINERMIDAGVANWEKNAGLISSPTGMRIVNFGAIADNESFRKLVKDAAETLVVDEIELGVFASDGDLISNDWRENPNGEDYRQRIAAAGSPDLLEWAGAVLAPRVQSVFNEFSSRYGWGDPGRIEDLFDQPAAETGANQEVTSTDPSAGDQNLQFSRRRKPAPKKTVKAYKLFRVNEKKPGQLFPLFIGKNEPVEMGVWYDADDIPTKGFASRPGWHAGDSPMATHIGEKSRSDLTAPDTRPANQVWAEIEMSADKDWQPEANRRGTNAKGQVVAVRADIKDQIPVDGFYRYKTNPNMTGTWLIGGSIKVNRILSDTEVERINRKAGVEDLPREAPFNAERYGFGKAKLSRQRTGPFYSQLAEAIDQVPERLATQPAAQWKAWLASNASKLGIKKDEIEWTGINDYLDLRGKDKVSKAEIADYLNANGIQVQDVMFTSDLEIPIEEKDVSINYDSEDMVTPDGDPASAIREFSFRDGGRRITYTAYEIYDEYEDRGWELFENGGLVTYGSLNQIREGVRELASEVDSLPAEATRFDEFQLPGGENYKELMLQLPDEVTKARGISDYRVPQLHRYGKREADYNRLAHVRFNDRVDADGNKVLFIEEIQSDWAQEGRKKGFARKGSRFNYEVSQAPFVTDTKAWVALTVKRMLAYAAENGYDKVAFIDGQQSADRYDLSKVVDSIDWELADKQTKAAREIRLDLKDSYLYLQADDSGVVTDVPLGSNADKNKYVGKKIDDVVGKELAKKIQEKTSGKLSGEGLKLGGEGMIKFYDQILPQVVNDVLKKLGGGKLEQVDIKGRERGGISGNSIMQEMGIPEAQRAEYWGNLTDKERDDLTENARNVSLVQPGFTVTDAMREKVAGGLPLFSRKRNYGTLTAAQEQALRNVGGIVPEQTVAQRAKELGEKFKRSWFSGIFDQFAPLKDVDQRAYMLARLSKGSDGALEALMLYGKPFMNGDVPDVNVNDQGFINVMATLKGEHDRFLWWVAAQRAENLKAQGRENLFTDQDISSLKSLNQGNFDDGTPRAQAYASALVKMNEFNDAVLNIAEQSGLIDGQARQLFKDMPYVPFYRVMEGGVEGPSFSSGLVNQRAWKKLKGGTQKLNEDLLSNVLLNWSHLFDAAGKNRAAVASMQAATQIGIAQEVPAGTKGAVKVMEQGQTKHYVIDDPYVMEAVTALNYQPPGFFQPFSTVKKWLTIGVTASPTFKIKNLMRDSLQAIGTAPMSYNVASNVMRGFKQGSQETQTFASMLAGGGLIRFGSMLEGTSRTQYMIERQGGILLNEGGWKKLQRQMTGLVEAYAELGDRLENVNRVSLYEHLVSKGYSQAEANFMSRDLMDFSLQGRWPVVRFLAQSVPFLNARLQGLSKLGRGAKDDTRRFGYVVGAVALASIALMLAYEDDEDWKKRPDWDRDSNWWFKIGDTAFRIPKPFEIGAIGTVAERTWEVAFNDEMSWKRYRQRLSHMIFETFAMDPTPQLVVPISEIYANKEGFTQRPIEGLGLQKLRPEDRATERTSSVARLLGQMGLPSPVSLVKGDYEKLSPVQIDHLIRGYFGWIGSTATTILDFGLRPLMDRGERPAYRLKDVFVAGNFAEGLPANSSRYVDQLYEQARIIEQAYMSYQDAKKKGDRERMRELVAEDGNKIKAYKSINKISRQVSEINRKIRQIESSKTLSADTKRKMIDQLSERKNQVAKKAQKFAKID